MKLLLQNPSRNLAAAASLAMLLSACSGPTPDVRLVLCKDLVSELQGTSQAIDWQDEKMQFQGYEDMQVKLSYKTGDKSATAVCFYRYEIHEENAMTQSNPASAYSSYPNKMVWDGKTVDHQLLADKVNAVLRKQGKQMIEAAKTNVKKAEEYIKSKP